MDIKLSANVFFNDKFFLNQTDKSLYNKINISKTLQNHFSVFYNKPDIIVVLKKRNKEKKIFTCSFFRCKTKEV